MNIRLIFEYFDYIIDIYFNSNYIRHKFIDTKKLFN